MTLLDLLQRATGGHKLNRQRVFRPSLAYQLLHDPFWIWCEHHAPRSEAVDETTRYERMRMQQGVEFEHAWIKANYPDAVTIKPAYGLEALNNTLEAILAGVRVIAQPQLWDLEGETYGKADLLIRDDSHASDLGPFHYYPVELKRSKSVRPYHVLQTASYNRMMGRIQGYTPERLTVALPTRKETIAYFDAEKELDDSLARWKDIRDGRWTPEPGRPPEVTDSPWRQFGNKLVDSRMDLVLLAGIGSRERDKLRQAGIHRVDRLWNLGLEEVCDILGEGYGRTAYYVAQAYRTRSPIPKPGIHLAIPRGKRHLYFDFETSDGVHPTEPPHVYLIGCWDAERDQFVKFLACGAEDEERIFTEFLDYIGEVETSRLYHWTDFETRQISTLMNRWPNLRGSLQAMLASCVDLKPLIQSAVYLPVPTFSIKSVAPALGFHWRQKAFGAFESMVCYWDYLETKGKGQIDKAVLYNEDDCVAMWHVDQELARLPALNQSDGHD